MDKTTADKLMYIPNNVTHNSVDYNYELVVETFVYSTKYINQSKFYKNVFF